MSDLLNAILTQKDFLTADFVKDAHEALAGSSFVIVNFSMMKVIILDLLC